MAATILLLSLLSASFLDILTAYYLYHIFYHPHSSHSLFPYTRVPYIVILRRNIASKIFILLLWIVFIGFVSSLIHFITVSSVSHCFLWRLSLVILFYIQLIIASNFFFYYHLLGESSFHTRLSLRFLILKRFLIRIICQSVSLRLNFWQFQGRPGSFLRVSVTTFTESYYLLDVSICLKIFMKTIRGFTNHIPRMLDFIKCIFIEFI